MRRCSGGWTLVAAIWIVGATTACGGRLEPAPDRTDRDFDGFIDRYDECPIKAETFNDFKDDDGCPDRPPAAIAKVAIVGSQIRIAQAIQFKSGKDIILKESYSTLDDVARLLGENPAISLRVEGHTDNLGADVANLQLSQRRADAVVKYLLKSGIAQERLKAVGVGESRPIDNNESEDGRNNNRRVEFHITRT